MTPDKHNIVTGRHAPQKRAFARALRADMTPAESRLWQRVRRSALGELHFRRQQIIDGFIADFYCHKAGLVVELDGPIHARAVEADRQRDLILSSRGLRILRFPNDRVMNDLEAVLKEILAAATEAS